MSPPRALALGLCLFLCSLPRALLADSVALEVAVTQNKVSIRAESIGGAMGNRLKIYLQKRVPGTLQLHVTPGLVFLPSGADSQRLAVVSLKGVLTAEGNYQRQPIISLTDDRQTGYLLQIVCIDYHKNSPPAGQAYLVGEVDLRCQRIFSAKASSSASTWAFQAAVWLDRTGIPASTLQQKFQVPAIDMQAADALLKQAEQMGIASLESLEVSPEAKTAAAAAFSSDPQVRVQAHQAVQALPAKERISLEILLKQNLAHTERLPTAAELIAGSDLQSLFPTGVELPQLQIPQSLDGLIAIIETVRKSTAAGSQSAPGSELFQESLRMLPHLIALKSRLPFVRLAAVQALALVKSPMAIEALIVLLDDQDAKTRELAAKGLRSLTGQNLEANRPTWESWWKTAHEEFRFQEASSGVAN